MSEFDGWDRRTAAQLEDAYVSAGAGPCGSGSTDPSEGGWRAKRQHLAVPMDTDGTWLDVGCANGHLLATLPAWAAERGITIEPHGLELLPRLADLARALHPHLAHSIWTGSVMSWPPPIRSATSPRSTTRSHTDGSVASSTDCSRISSHRADD